MVKTKLNKGYVT